MKQTEKNEMDLLLRSLAQRGDAGSPATEDHSAEHLDADELNSYAEQVLPAVARARYTAHLADCARCRNIVTELRSASGAHVSQQAAAPETSGLRQRLAAFFAPGLWRLAVPALALVAFITVGLVVFRTAPMRGLVAVNEPAASSREVAEQTRRPEQHDGFLASNENSIAKSRSNTGRDENTQAKSGEIKEDSKVTTVTDSVASSEGASVGKSAGVVDKREYAPEPVAPPKPQAPPAESQSEVVAREKKEADKNEDERGRDQAGSRARTDEQQNQSAQPQASGRTLAVQSEERTRTPAAKRSSGAGAKAKDDAAETRTVSGRHFRWDGSRWVDTAYQSSMATTTLSRGSEQFRALVADEREIREIAAHLSGEVIVVWKGRAYRIR